MNRSEEAAGPPGPASPVGRNRIVIPSYTEMDQRATEIGQSGTEIEQSATEIGQRETEIGQSEKKTGHRRSVAVWQCGSVAVWQWSEIVRFGATLNWLPLHLEQYLECVLPVQALRPL